MNSMTHALIDYWHRLPATPASVRRRSLEDTRRRVRAGETAPVALVAYALADTDEDLVYDAASEYLDSSHPGDFARSPSLDDTLEWIRRHLALNRGAIFAALLGRGDPAINERLAALRLTLSADDVATVSRHVVRHPSTHSRQFLRDWLELLAGEELRPEHEHLAGALGESVVSRAA